MKSPRTLRALFSMPGFVARGTLTGVFGDRYARVITLRRQKKQRSVPTVATAAGVATISTSGGCVISQWPTGGSTSSSSAGASSVPGAVACM